MVWKMVMREDREEGGLRFEARVMLFFYRYKNAPHPLIFSSHQQTNKQTTVFSYILSSSFLNT